MACVLVATMLDVFSVSGQWSTVNAVCPLGNLCKVRIQLLLFGKKVPSKVLSNKELSVSMSVCRAGESCSFHAHLSPRANASHVLSRSGT